jgi:hypothetical protein
MKLESLNEGKIILHGKSYNFQTYMPRKTVKTNGLWRMLRIHDFKGNEIITIYNVLKDSLRNAIITSLRDRNLIAMGRGS